MLSVVIPVYNEEDNIDNAASTIGAILSEENIDYELIFIDDGSTDSSWNRICALSGNSQSVHGICFSRNFGKESAIYAGLCESKGDCVTVIDCDLQHPPEKIIDMYHLWESGYEIIEGIKTNRGDESGLHTFAAGCFYDIISKATDSDMRHASDFKLLDRKAVNALINMPEKNAFFRALSSWIGFKSTHVEYEVRERSAGRSKWSTRSLIRYAISNIASFTSFPIHIVTVLGTILFIVSLIIAAIALYQKIAGIALGGFTTVILLLCFTSSIIMISLGIIGYYIARIYEEIKGRPRYIISEQF